MKNIIVRTFSIIALAAVIGLLTVSCTLTQGSFKEPIYGVVYNIALPAKDIQIIGIVRVETKVDYNGNGELITYDALLKAAEAVGGNGIANIMIDKMIQKSSVMSDNSTIWYGSALAIMFTNDNLTEGTRMSTITTRLKGNTVSEDNGAYGSSGIQPTPEKPRSSNTQPTPEESKGIRQ